MKNSEAFRSVCSPWDTVFVLNVLLTTLFIFMSVLQKADMAVWYNTTAMCWAICWTVNPKMFIFALQQYGISTKLISLSREQVWWDYIVPVPELYTVALTLMSLSSSKHKRNSLIWFWKILPYNIGFFLKEEIHLSCYNLLNW